MALRVQREARGPGGIDLARMVGEPSLPGTAADGTRALIFAEVLTAGPLSRTDVARRLGLSQSTVTKAVNPLIEMGYLIEAGDRSSGSGRPQRLVKVSRDRHAVIGVKLAPTQVTGVLTDLEATVLTRFERTMEVGYSPEAGLAAATAVIYELLAAQPGARERLLGVGVGLGGHVDTARGRCVRSGILGWDDVDIAQPLSAALGMPTLVSNNVNALVVAEHWFGSGRDSDCFAVVTVGPGVGCGLLLGGELHHGISGQAGELGHTPLQPDGPLCTCGNRGCLEAAASDAAILAQIPGCASIEEARRLARGGSPTAVAAFAAMGEALGRGLAVLCNLLNLEKIVLTGEGAVAYDLFGPACEESWRRHSFSTTARDCTLVVDTADDDLWARGAACLVIREAASVSPA